MINKALDRPTKPLWSAFLLLAPLFFLLHSLFHSYFHVNDDDWVVFFTKGVGLSLHPDPHIYTNNILLGYLLKWLYSHFNSINWYAYGLLFSVFLSFWAILSSLLLSSFSSLKMKLFLTGFVFYGVFFLIHLNYTMEATLLAQGGIFLLVVFYQRPSTQGSGWLFALASLCLALSFLIRPESFGLALITAAPFLFFVFWGNVPPLRSLLPLFALGILLTSCQWWNAHCYDKDPGWKNFVEKISCFRQFYDWRNMDFNERTRPYFEEIGWDRNDAELFKNYFFMDENKFSIENLKKLGPHLPPVSLRGKGGNVASLWDVLVLDRHSLVLLACCFFFCLYLPRAKYPWVLLNFLWVLGLILFLMYFARALERVFLPCLAYMVFLSLFLVVPPSPSGGSPKTRSFPLGPRTLQVIWILMLVFSVPFLGMLYWENRLSNNVSRSFKDSIKEMGPKDDQLFVVWGSDLYHENLDAFDDFDLYRNFHIFIFGAWSLSPYGQEMLDHFHIKDIRREMVDRSDVFLICKSNRGRMLRKFILKNDHRNIGFKKVFSCYFFNTYQMFEQKGPPKDPDFERWLSIVLDESTPVPPPPPDHVVSKILNYTGMMDTMDLYLVAKALVRIGHFQEAEPLFQKAGEQDPEFAPPPGFLKELERRGASPTPTRPGAP